ncbi:MAG TPA: tRNA (adenosine(37)-N6)-dimethylallyltransferase MiaA [Acidimicrobiia bacterium]
MGVTHLALVGPTASGKSALALALARAFGDVEIVSVDSMQVYRGMDVGTAKPSPEERAAVAHHLIDIADPWEDWSVARFQAAARAAVADVEARGRRALLVGGTGLYVQAVVDDLSFPGEDLALRAELEAWTAEPGGVAAAYAELESADPAAAAKVDPHNARRIVRALEVTRLTGRPFSSFGPGLRQFGETAFPVRVAGVWLPRAALSRRIGDRFGAMRAGGLVDEVQGLAADPRGLSRSAAQAIGYKEILAALDGPRAGESTRLDEAFDLAVRRTRSFARRQRMWFRRDPRITWLATSGNSCRLLPQLLALWSP